MRKTTNKILSALIAAALVFGMVTTASAASEGDTAPTAASVQETVETPAEDQQEPAAEETVTEEPAAEDSEEQKEEAPAAAEEEKAEEQKEEAPAEEAPAEEIAPAEEAAPAEEVAPAEEEAVETVSEPEEETAAAMPAQTFSKTVKEKVKGKNKTVVKVEVSAPEGAFPEGTEMTVKKVGENDRVGGRKRGKTYRQAIESVARSDVKTIMAVDITFTKDGKEIEPAKDISVSFKGDSLAAKEGQTLSIVHIADDGSAEVIKDAEINEKKQEATFDAGDFSVYAVLGEGETGDNARLFVTFEQANDGDPITIPVKKTDMNTEIIDGESVNHFEQVLYDPGVGTLNGRQTFRGWTTDEDYTAETKGLSIEDVRTAVAALLNEGVNEGDTITYYPMIFDVYSVTFLDEDGAGLGADTILLKDGESETYTIDQFYEPKYTDSKFVGWGVAEKDANGKWIIPDGAHVYQNGDTVTFGAGEGSLTEDLVLKAKVPSGYWLIFKENGKGASYTPPEFYQGTATVRPADPTRFGYTFGGWYTDEACTTSFTFGGILESTTRVYAKWTPNATAGYTVIIWKEKSSDTYANNAASGKTRNYDFWKAYNMTGNVGDTINAVTNSNTQTSDVNGSYYDVRIRGTAANGQAVNEVVSELGYHTASYETGVTITPEGTSIVNVYYDRHTVTYTFHYPYQNRQWQTYQSEIGLYGEKLNWPTDSSIWWYPNSGNNGVPSGTRMSYKNDFIPLDTDMSVDYYGRTGSGDKLIRFYTQDLDNTNNWTMEVELSVGNSVGSFDVNDKFTGFKAYQTRTFTSNYYGGGSWSNWANVPDEPNTSGIYTRVNFDNILEVRYKRLSNTIVYMDGKYFDGDGNEKKEANRGKIHETDEFFYETDLTSYNKNQANYYIPETIPTGYVFAGWYADEGCTLEYNFTTMPVSGVTVYAKWIQKEYRVFLYPNAVIKQDGTDIDDPTFESGEQATSFKISYEEEINFFKANREEYTLNGWYRDPDFTQSFNFDAFVANDQTVTTPYDQTESTERDYYGHNTSETNKDHDNNRFWITTKLELYAKWRHKLIGADGITVEYESGEEGQFSDGSTLFTDPLRYQDTADASAQGAAQSTTEEKEFKYWVLQTWDEDTGTFVPTGTKVLPGEHFTINIEDARRTENADHTEEDPSYTYTIKLIAEYGSIEAPTPTHITWYSNIMDVAGNEFDLAKFGGTKVQKVDNKGWYVEEKPVNINEGYDIKPADTYSYPGYTFLGWAKLDDDKSPEGKVLKEEDLFLKWVVNDQGDGHFEAKNDDGEWVTVTKVAADENHPYEDLYAVWKGSFYIYHSGIDGDGGLETIDMPAAGETYNLIQNLTDNTLYGGYYLDYEGKGDYKGDGVKGTTGVAYNGWNYDWSGAQEANEATAGSDGYKDEVLVKPEAGVTYYIKEVPTYYLRNYHQLNYMKTTQELKALYLISAVDDENYNGYGVTLTNGDEEVDIYTYIKFTNYATKKSVTLTAKSMFGRSYGLTEEGAEDAVGAGHDRVTFWDATESDYFATGQFTVLPFWVTKDGVKVSGVSTRTITISEMTRSGVTKSDE